MPRASQSGRNASERPRFEERVAAGHDEEVEIHRLRDAFAEILVPGESSQLQALRDSRLQPQPMALIRPLRTQLLESPGPATAVP